MSKTNFDRHLEKYLQDPAFAEKFEKAGEEWDIALQLAGLRQKAGLSQSQLARKLKTSQQQISRLESPSYEGHSLSMLRRVAEALNAKIVVSFQPQGAETRVHDAHAPYAPQRETPGKARTTKTGKGTRKTAPVAASNRKKTAKEAKAKAKGGASRK